MIWILINKLLCREIDGNIYPGEVRDKEIAKNAYENARLRGHTAGHIETR